MRILITGGSGLLGSELVKTSIEYGFETHATYLNHPTNIPKAKWYRLDLTDKTKTFETIFMVNPDVIIHSAALTSVDLCEENKSMAWRMNVDATRTIAQASLLVGAHLVYISTAYVFDGEKGLYRESDFPRPINYYGLTKLLGENTVSFLSRTTIIRPSLILGVRPDNKSFVEVLIRKIKNKEKFAVPDDQYISPITSSILARAIIDLVSKNVGGIYHIAGPRMTRYETAIRIAEYFGLDTKYVVPTTRESTQEWSAPRPRDTSLNIKKARQTLGWDFDDIELNLSALRELLKNKNKE